MDQPFYGQPPQQSMPQQYAPQQPMPQQYAPQQPMPQQYAPQQPMPQPVPPAAPYYPAGAWQQAPPVYYPPVPVDPMEPYRRQDIRTVRSRSNWLGAAMLFSMAFSTVFSLLFQVLFELLLPYVSVESIYYDAFQYVLYSPVAILLPFWIAVKGSRQSLSELIPFEKHSFGIGLACVLFSFGFIAAGNLLTEGIIWLFPQVYDSVSDLLTDTAAVTPVERAIEILYVAAVPALVEEFAFRGVALGSLRKYGDGFAIFFSALLFSLIHGNFYQIPFVFLLGLVMGFAVVRTGSIVPAIVIHFINNAMSCVLSYLYGSFEMTARQERLFDLVLYGSWILLGIIGYVILRVSARNKLTECFRPNTGCITAARRNGTFLATAPMILTIVLYLLNALILLWL